MTTTVSETLPAAPVLVRTDCPGQPFAYIDPTPHRPDANGHVWRFNVDEPSGAPFCLLCCIDAGDPPAGRRCDEAPLLLLVNADRDRWIAEHRVDGEAVSA